MGFVTSSWIFVAVLLLAISHQTTNAHGLVEFEGTFLKTPSIGSFPELDNASSPPGAPLHKEVHLTVPKKLLRRLSPEYRLLAGGDASNPYPRALRAFHFPLFATSERATKRLLKDIQLGLQYVLQTTNKWTFALHGSGSSAITAVLDNMIEPGDKIIVVLCSHWGEVAAFTAHQLGGNVIAIEKPPGEQFLVEEAKQLLAQHKPKILYLVHGDSTTGLLQSLEGFGDLCRKNNVYFVVDVMWTVGIIPILMDKRRIDVAIMSSEKGLGGVAGLAPVSFSPRAIEMIQKRTTLTKIYHMQIVRQGEAWVSDKSAASFPVFVHQISMPLLYSLREALASIAAEGVEHGWTRHGKASKLLYKKIARLGLEFYVANETNRLPGTTLVNVPHGKDARKIASIFAINYHIEISPGAGVSLGKVLRIGLYGINAQRSSILQIMRALSFSLQSSGIDDPDDKNRNDFWNH